MIICKNKSKSAECIGTWIYGTSIFMFCKENENLLADKIVSCCLHCLPAEQNGCQHFLKKMKTSWD